MGFYFSVAWRRVIAFAHANAAVVVVLALEYKETE